MSKFLAVKSFQTISSKDERKLPGEGAEVVELKAVRVKQNPPRIKRIRGVEEEEREGPKTQTGVTRMTRRAQEEMQLRRTRHKS